jgi:hypothetical protein
MNSVMGEMRCLFTRNLIVPGSRADSGFAEK